MQGTRFLLMRITETLAHIAKHAQRSGIAQRKHMHVKYLPQIQMLQAFRYDLFTIQLLHPNVQSFFNNAMLRYLSSQAHAEYLKGAVDFKTPHKKSGTHFKIGKIAFH